MGLDILRGGPFVSDGRGNPGRRRCTIAAAAIERPRAMVRVRPGKLHRHVNVRQLMLYRLHGGDRPARTRSARARRRRPCPVPPARRRPVRRRNRIAARSSRPHHIGPAGGTRQRFRGGAVKIQCHGTAAQFQRAQRVRDHAGAALDKIKPDRPGSVARRDHNDSGGATVEHRQLAPGYRAGGEPARRCSRAPVRRRLRPVPASRQPNHRQWPAATAASAPACRTAAAPPPPGRSRRKTEPAPMCARFPPRACTKLRSPVPHRQTPPARRHRASPCAPCPTTARHRTARRFRPGGAPCRGRSYRTGNAGPVHASPWCRQRSRNSSRQQFIASGGLSGAGAKRCGQGLSQAGKLAKRQFVIPHDQGSSLRAA